MASSILHIKDSYYFEVPRFLCKSKRETIHDFPEVWIKNDPEYQHWEAHELAHRLEDQLEDYNARQKNHRDRPQVEIPDGHDLIHHWEHWQHEDHINAGRPFDVYVEREFADFEEAFDAWALATKEADKSIDAFFADAEASESFHETAVLTAYFQDKDFRKAWTKEKAEVTVDVYLKDGTVAWSHEKIDSYNARLHGKIIIPQPFGGKLRNLYEPESGFCLSKFMMIEVAVSLILIFGFSWLARRISSGKPAKGRMANFLELFLVFIRDQIARPAIGHGADKFVPLLWTLFLFVLGCNLFGMLPWMGAPTGSWGITAALALVTFGTVIVCGMMKFGFAGFFLNQIPSMDLPLPIAIVLKPMILAIELLGLLIKHLVLSVRLLANMLAGHMVLLAIFAMAIGFEATTSFAELPGWQHGITMVIVLLGTTAFSCLELFVAFLQAYVFTFLSALFISAAVHHH